MPKDKYEPPNEMRQHRIMQRNEIADGKPSRWSELEIFGFVQNLSLQLWKVEWLTVLYLDNNHLSHLPPHIGHMVNLEHLDASHNFIDSVPHEIGELVNLRELKFNSNRIRELPSELGKCFQLQTLDLTNNPLTYEVNKYYTESVSKLLSALMDNVHYEMSLPPNRPWITTGNPDADVPAAVFTVMCYNVLCDNLCTKAMYGYCPTWALNWDYRKKGIMNDILRGNADIITLQEVETEQYYSMFLPELAQQGYDGIFLPKSRVRTMDSDKKKCVDGCAIFFKKNKFEKVNEYQMEFSQLATKEGASNTDTDMINRVSTKDNIAIVAVLRTRPAVYENSPVPHTKGLTQMLMVSTAHIHWDPQLPDVKLVQTMMLVEELQKFVKEASMRFRPNAPPPSLDAADLCTSMPLILCGDFNSLPDSGVYEFLSKGRLDTSHKDFEGQNYQVFMKDRNDNGIITHNFKLTSAYKDIIPFTNYTFDFKGIIDYVFYSDQHLRLHGVMGLQDEEWFRVNKIVGCPHPFVPSDHFPLFAEFSLPASAQRPR